MNIYQRMHAVMGAVSYVQKEDKKVNGQYTFVSHDAVTAKLRPALIQHGIVTVPRVIKHTQDGNRTEVDIEVDFVNIDKPDERVTIPMFGFGIDPQDKGPGKAISYAVKYALLKAFSLETGDDPERDSIPHAKPEPAKTAQPDAAGKKALEECASLDELAAVWKGLAPAARATLGSVKDACKTRLMKQEEATQA